MPSLPAGLQSAPEDLDLPLSFSGRHRLEMRDDNIGDRGSNLGSR
jgi:hypothetical protein